MLSRPPFHLSSLSVEYRWETTRRHPIYIQLWNMLQSASFADDVETESFFRNDPSCTLAAKLIGISGPPIDPATEFSDIIDSNMKRAWLRGAIQPVPVRAIVAVLLSALDARTLDQLATILRAAEGDPRSDERLKSLLRLYQCESSVLDGVLDAPYYSISPVAPREQLVSDLVNLQDAWRTRLNLPTKRDTAPKYPNYLRVWDMREGWHEGRYDRTQARTIKSISRELGKNAKTVNGWYRRGFELVAGHKYTQANWIALMGSVHLSELFGPVSPVTQKRAINPPTRQDVDNTTISTGLEDLAGGLVGQRASSDLGDGAATAERILRHIDDGLRNAEICDELEMDECIEPAIEVLRTRREI
jgi:hypothetical protein